MYPFGGIVVRTPVRWMLRAVVIGAVLSGPAFMGEYPWQHVSGRPDCVKMVKLISKVAIAPDGTYATIIPGANQGIRYDYDNGGDLQITVPPVGWNPVTATDAELKIYHLPPRPATAGMSPAAARAALAAWDARYRNYSQAPVVAPCYTNSTS
ncbi:MAG TPA: hypothetical protein VHC41_03000 [Mycobacteriales bacterium]|nr:hypothetical protein [Mycobacteriales bacterium]